MAKPQLLFEPASPDTTIDKESEVLWLALVLTPGLGPRRGQRLLARFPDIRQLFQASRSQLESCGLSGTVAQSLASACMIDDAITQQERAKAAGCHLLPFIHPRYPALLRTLPDPPLMLFARGNVDLLSEVCVAVVGTRRPSTYGKAAAAKLSAEIATLGICVVSGMARGIDTAAHQAALDADGNTIAVFGCGVDVLYPTENKKLAEQIAAKGLLLSEFPMGEPAYPQNFPLRNRIVSGVSDAVLVVEGAQYSGSAITARLALEQDREVFAVPGNITSRASWGPNLLIKQGAVLVQEAMDILNGLPSHSRVRLYRRMHEEAQNLPAVTTEEQPAPLDNAQRQVLARLKVDEGKLMDELMDELPEMSSSEIIAALFYLEMEGLAKQDVTQRYTRTW
jgi:DNA processing protein